MQELVILIQQIIILVLLLCLPWSQYKRRFKGWWKSYRQKPKQKRQLRPRDPSSCADCCWEHHWGWGGERTQPSPWIEIKSRRGRPKAHSSEGYACSHGSCPYYKVKDERVHALRRDVWWETDSVVWHGAVSAQNRQRKSSASDPHADISEILEVPPDTVQGWLDRAGRHSQRLHQRLFQDLVLHYIQLDELATKVRNHSKQVWVWTGMDVTTKLWIAWVVRDRSQKEANGLLHQIYRRLRHDVTPAFTSDGLNQYFYAITPHWGSWEVVEGKRKPVWVVAEELLYGQLKKVRTRYKLRQITTTMLCGERAAMRVYLQALALSGNIQTAFVERLNLSLRHIVPALRRRTWALANNIHSLRLRVALGAAYYNFCRPHQALPMGNKHFLTPAMAAGVTNHRWTVREFLLHPVY
jgi:IS1 family transposase